MQQSHKFPNIGIIGYGAFGFALSVAFSDKADCIIAYERNTQLHLDIAKLRSHPLFPAAKIPSNVKITNILEDVLEANLLLICVPAQNVRQALSLLRDTAEKYDAILRLHLTPIILCAKGIENSSLKLISDIAIEILPSHQIIGILSGPNLAHELVQEKSAIANLGCTDQNIGYAITQNLSSSGLVLKYCNDIKGLQICGAVKNVIAIAAGIVKGLDWGENAYAALLTNSISEITSLIEEFGGKQSTILESAGIGDLLLTSMSTSSRNFRFGLKNAHYLLNKQTIACDPLGTVEGYYTAIALEKIAHRIVLSLPIIKSVHSIITNSEKDNPEKKESLINSFNNALLGSKFPSCPIT